MKVQGLLLLRLALLSLHLISAVLKEHLKSSLVVKVDLRASGFQPVT